MICTKSNVSNLSYFYVQGAGGKFDIWLIKGSLIRALINIMHQFQHRVAHRVRSACVSLTRTRHWHVSFWATYCCSKSRFDTRQAPVLSALSIVWALHLQKGGGCVMRRYLQIRQVHTARNTRFVAVENVIHGTLIHHAWLACGGEHTANGHVSVTRARHVKHSPPQHVAQQRQSSECVFFLLQHLAIGRCVVLHLFLA